MQLTSRNIPENDCLATWTLEHTEPYCITKPMLDAAESLRLWPIDGDDGTPLGGRFRGPYIFHTDKGILFRAISDDYVTPAEGRKAIYTTKQKLERRLDFLRCIAQALTSDTEQFKQTIAEYLAETVSKSL